MGARIQQALHVRHGCPLSVPRSCFDQGPCTGSIVLSLILKYLKSSYPDFSLPFVLDQPEWYYDIIASAVK